MKTVLIVDDDPQFRALMVPILVSRSVQVFEAGSGRAADTLMQTHQPDLIVVDGLLPDTDGMTWIQRVREAGSKARIIFASAFWKDKKTFQRLTTELGVAAVVQKPVQASVLAAQIEAQLQSIVSVDDIEITESEPEADFGDELKALRRTYGQSLPGKVDELGNSVESITRGEPDAVEETRMLAHRLRGTAGSYGFEEIGEVAGRIEDDVREMHPDELPYPEQVTRLRQWVDQLKGLAKDANESVAEDVEEEESKSAERILVVDDDAAFLQYVQDLARPQAIEILPARSREAALEAAHRTQPDAAIVDVNPPTSDAAYKLVRELRAIPGCETLPIAFMSSQATLQTRILAAHAGGSLFLTKPLDQLAFSDATQQLLALRQSKPRVLLLDDDADFRAHLSVLLQREGMNVLALSEATDLFEHLTRFRPDLLLLDVMMPKVSGFDICRMLRTAREWRDLPIFFLTGRTGVEARVSAFRAGADDYLAKPIVPEELLARIQVRLDRMRLMEERAEKDAVTGVSLRRSFMTRFSAYVTDATRKNQPVSFVIIDIDRFKQVNDERGHLSGDRVLAGFGKLLTTRFRANDLRGRWGGDEFVLCFPNETLETTAGIIERLLEELRKMTFEGDIGGKFGVTFTAGVASFPADGANVHDLVRSADRRLLVAKKAGRNRVASKD